MTAVVEWRGRADNSPLYSTRTFSRGVARIINHSVSYQSLDYDFLKRFKIKTQYLYNRRADVYINANTYDLQR